MDMDEYTYILFGFGLHMEASSLTGISYSAWRSVWIAGAEYTHILLGFGLHMEASSLTDIHILHGTLS